MRPTHRTARLTLRWIGMDDAPRIAALAGNWNVARMLSRLPHPYPDNGAEDWIATHAAMRAEGRGSSYAIVTPEDGLVGVVGIERLEDHDVELGYWLGEPYWGRGYASEAAAAAVDIGFEDMGLTCMTSGHFEENPASGRVLARCGFRYTGRSLRPCLARGHDMPSIEMALTRADWSARQQPGEIRPA